MKKCFLLSMVALLLSIGMQAKSAADYASAPSAGAFYLYSIAQNKFLNTSVNSPGLIAIDGTPVATTLTDNGDGTYMMSGVSGKFLKLGVWRGQYLWSDADGTSAFTKWTFTLTEGKKYQISSAEGNYSEGSIKGTWYISGTNATDVAENAEEFYLVSETQLEAFLQQMPIDAAKAELADLMKQAEALSVSTTDAKAVYDSETATLEEVKAAVETLKAAIIDAQNATTTPESPVDVTKQYIPNSTFEQNFDGWVSDAGAKNNQIQTNDGLVGDGGVTGKFWENWKGAASLDGRMYTEVTLPNGVYSFTLGAFADSPNTLVYANNDFVSVEKHNDGDHAKLYTVVTLVTNDTLEAGLKTTGETHWMGIDNAKLLYLGVQLESYKYWFEAHKKVANYEENDVKCQSALLEQFNNAMTTVENATTKEAIVEAINTLVSVESLLKENIAAYEELQATLDEAYALMLTLSYKPLDKYFLEHGNDVEDGELTTEEAKAVKAQMEALIDEARKQGTAVGGDVTDVLTNPNFTEGLKGWTISVGSLKTGGNGVNPMAESWQTNFNMYQEVKDLANGVYQLDFSGFGRHSGYETSWAERENPVEMAYAYMNKTETVVKDYAADATTDATLYTSPYVVEETYYLPNNLDNVARGMKQGLYANTVYGIVTDGTLRIGLYSENMTTDCWVAWDSFRLTFQGKDVNVLTSAMPAIVKQMKRYLTADMSAAVKGNLNAAITKGESNPGTTGEEMFDTYAELEALIATVKSSIATYDTLKMELSSLIAVKEKFGEKASEKTQADAQALINLLQTNIPAGTYTDAEAKEMYTTIEAMKKALRVPAGIEIASDQNPVDVTSMIVNASFDNNDDEGWSGTPMGHQKVQAAELFNKNFDVYQTITGLPEGTYEVGVTGFYRNGWNKDDVAEPYRRYVAGEKTNAYLYAVVAGDTASVNMTSLWAGAVEDSVLTSGIVKITVDEKSFYVPNSMGAAVTFFEESMYTDNSLLVKVTDGNLTIGMKKNVLISSDWTMFDDFRLTYYGKNSQKETGIEEVQASSFKVHGCYDLQGRRIMNPTKGLYIINGKKVMKR